MVESIQLPLAVSALLVFSAVAQASTLLNENFDELTAKGAATSVGAFHTIGGTNVDILGASFFGGLCSGPESGGCVDMSGSGGNPQGVLQSNSAYALSPGVDYALSFDLIGSQRGTTASTTVTFATYSQTFVLSSSDFTDGIVSTIVTVPTAGSYYLTFTDNTAGNVGEVLDNVSITTGTPITGTPEPASFSLLAGGVLALIGLSRFRHPAVMAK